MSELKDPGIKLFGKTISLPQYEGAADSSTIDDIDRFCHHHHHHRGRDNQSSPATTAASQDEKNTSEGELTGSKQDDDSANQTAEESTGPGTVSGTSDDNKTFGVENETASPPNSSKKEELDVDNTQSQEKTLKKPDKILPCPRCNSMDTKFCYYNNYNVNQPRHFCKNCQRYWTAGGTMRNVPVGSGRRKNKNSPTANYRHIMISDALQAARVDVANGIHLPSLKANGTVLTFGSERPLCESMATALNLAEISRNHLPNGFHEPEQIINVAPGGKEIPKDNNNSNSNGTSSTTTSSTEIGGRTESAVKNCPAPTYLPLVPPFPSPWPCPWNAPQWRTPLPAPAFSPPGFPISFYPAPAYWGCAAPNPWTMPWPPPAPSSSDNSALSTCPSSPTLGKHSRDGNVLSPKNMTKDQPSEERVILIPKTLRIDDPNEAAKSSIWSTLGIKNDKITPTSRTTLFKAFPSKHNERNHIADTSLVLQANPAAYSRSQSFQESM